MPGLAEIILAAGLVFGGHKLNHEFEADKQNVPFKSGMIWKAQTNDKKKLARIAGAGARGQGTVTKALAGTRLENPALIASALNNFGYAIKPEGIQGAPEGDVRMINNNMGKKARQGAQVALTVSAISDMLKAFGKVKSDKGFSFGQSNNGTPMLVFGGSF